MSFASNDYLGLTHHPAVVAAAHDAIDRWGTGAGAARLIVGSRPVHHELEAELADWKGTEAAVLFTTGFAANLGVLTTFAGPDTLVCSDELNHASLIDGRRLAGAPLAVYRHLDAAHVDELLRANTHARAIVVTETMFSMDGDVAPVDKLLDVCAHHGALLVLDEAHSVLGPAVRAYATTCDRAARRHAVEDPRRARRLRRRAAPVHRPARQPRPRLHLHHRVESRRRRRRARRAARAALPRGRRAARPPARQRRPAAPRAPVADRARTCAAARRARSRPPTRCATRGFLVTAIRPPTVPPGTSRLRVALSADHTLDQVDALAAALAELFPRP